MTGYFIPKKLMGEIIQALNAPTHEANSYNCQDWPPGEGCAGCDGDGLRENVLIKLKKECEKQCNKYTEEDRLTEKAQQLHEPKALKRERRK